MSAITTAIGLYIAFIFLTTWVSPTIKRRAVGYGLFADVTMHVTLQVMFGGDADGRAGMLIAGVFINLTMHAYRYFNGYETWSREAGWVHHQPTRLARRAAAADEAGVAPEDREPTERDIAAVRKSLAANRRQRRHAA